MFSNFIIVCSNFAFTRSFNNFHFTDEGICLFRMIYHLFEAYTVHSTILWTIVVFSCFVDVYNCSMRQVTELCCVPAVV